MTKYFEPAFDPFAAEELDDDLDLACFHNAVSQVSESVTSNEGQSNPWSSSTWMGGDKTLGISFNASSSSGYVGGPSENEREYISFGSLGDDVFGSESEAIFSSHQKPNTDQNTSNNNNNDTINPSNNNAINTSKNNKINETSYTSNNETSFDSASKLVDFNEKHRQLEQQQQHDQPKQQKSHQTSQQRQEQKLKPKQQEKQQKQKLSPKKKQSSKQQDLLQNKQEHRQQQMQIHDEKKDQNVFEPSSSTSSPSSPLAVEPLFPADPMESMSTSIKTNPSDEMPFGSSSSKMSRASTTTARTTATETQQQAKKLHHEQLEKQQKQELTPSRTIELSIREQLITLYDDQLKHPNCEVQGSIHVNTSGSTLDPFLVVIKDKSKQLATLVELPHISRDVTKEISQDKTKKVAEGDRILRVSLPQNDLLSESPISRYVCSPQLRPIPMLVKSRVQVTNEVSRVGFKIRANPSNTYALTDMVILMAIPPFVKGQTIKMSRKGGVWDEMKRTVVWKADKLERGEVLEVQAQFENLDKKNSNENSSEELNSAAKFPLLVRCSLTDFLFSDIEVSTSSTDDISDPLKAKITRCAQILHRKV